MEETTQDFGQPMENAPVVTPAAFDYLRQASPWIKFIAILGFIGLGIMVIMSIVMLVSAPMIGAFIAPMYLILAVIMFFPLYYLIKYSNHLKDFSFNRDSTILEKAFDFQKKFWKFYGIVTIISFVLAIIFFIIAAAFNFQNFMNSGMPSGF